MVAAFGSSAGNFNPAKRIFIPTGGIDYSAYLYGGTPGFQQPVFSPLVAGAGFAGSFPQTINGMNNYYQEMYVRQNIGSLAITDALSNFQRKLINNESSAMPYAWANFKDSIKNTREYMMLERYGMATEQNINALAKSKYAQISGTNLDADIDENTHGNLASGFINGITFGIAQDKSGDQVREELLGIEEPRGAAVTRTIGSVAGGAAAGAATGAAIGSIVPGIGTAIGAGVGACVGAVGGFISKLWS